MKPWLIYTFTSAILGFILGYALLWVWFLFSRIILGYGDSGPSWLNIVNDIFFYGGLMAGIIAGQLWFFLKKAK
jgi:hypothetical protein